MTEHDRSENLVPDFDVALWGYDRQQVEECVTDLTDRLRDALHELATVDELRARLRQSELELTELRATTQSRPQWSEHLAKIMEAAEQLRDQAEREARAVPGRA